MAGNRVAYLQPGFWRKRRSEKAATLTDIPDETLATQVGEGKRQAFEELVRRHAVKFHAFAYRYLKQEQEAEDVVQDCFIKFWQRPKTWDPERGSKFTTWFYRVIMNACHDRARARKRSEPLSEDIERAPDDGMDVDAKMQKRDTARIMRDHLNTLPDRQRQAVTLCFYEGLSHKEAAEVMETSAKAVESLLMRAKAALRLRIDNREELI